MSNWNKLRSHLQKSERDLDAEFEQFLNESISEESVSSPRNKSPDLKNKDFGHPPPEVSSSKPWWESSAEDESSKDKVAQSWFKTTATVREEEEEYEGDAEGKKSLASPEETVPDSEVGAKTEETVPDSEVAAKTEVSQNIGVSVTMSKDSLDDGADKVVNSEKDSQSDRQVSIEEAINDDDDDDDDENYSYTEPTGTPTSTPSPRREAHEGGEQGALWENTETELNTQKEQEEKQEFFEKLEQENESNLDYRKLNEMLDEETSVTDHARTGDLLQATGAELGNSIFNATGTVQVSLLEKEATRASPEKNSLKPSMLSKVSLMDSLESSMGTAHQQKIKQIRQKQIDLPVAEVTGSHSFQDPIVEHDEYSVNIDSDAEDVGPGTTKTDGVGTGTGFLDTSGADQLANLQQALKAAQLITTSDSIHMHGLQGLGKGAKMSDSGTSEAKASQDKITVKKDSLDDHPNQPSDVMHTVNQPVIASTADQESKALSFSPSVSIPQLNQTLAFPSELNGMAQEQHGIILTRSTGQDHVKPVLGNLDIFQTRQTGFPSYLSSGFELPEHTEHAVFDERGVLPQGISVRDESGGPKGLGTSTSSVNENHGFSLKPSILETGEGSSEDDTPPAESLKGIKSIVKKRRQTQKKVNVTGGSLREAKKTPGKVSPKITRLGKNEVHERSSEAARSRQGKAKAKRELGAGDNNRSRFGWRNTCEVTPSRGRRGISGNERKEKPDKSSKKQGKAKEQTSPAHLMASVESFANYLNTFVHGDENVADPSRVDWSHKDADESLDESPGTKRLSREQALLREVGHWRLMWQDERKQNEKLVDELTEKDKEWKRREQSLNLEYKKEINDLKQKVFVLESKLKDVDSLVNNKKRVAKGGSLKGMSVEELRKLEKEIREQDKLLTGYQQENERLYEDLKDTRTNAKTAETQMFKENQKLATEVASLKEKLERKEGIFGAAGAATLGAERIHQLHSQVQVFKTNEQEMRKEIDELEKERRKSEKEVKLLERERDMAVKRADEVLGTNSQVLHEMESSHTANIERLNRKLKWYVENQDLLDKDAASLREKNEEIKELRELVQRLEAERGSTTIEKHRKEKERAGDGKRIQDLERQVREMEQIIKRRYPNSIPALIYAASAAPGDGKALKPEDSPTKSNAPSYAFLENRVKKLDRELEEREEDWGRSFRVLEQKYNAMQLEYEEHVTGLQRELNDTREKVTSHSHTRAHAKAIEKDLDVMRDKYEQKTQQLNGEIKVLREALHSSKNEAAQTESKLGKTKRSKRDTKVTQNSGITEDEIEGRLKTLREECERKDRVVEELKSTCAQLQRQREDMLSEKGIVDSTKAVQRNLEERLGVVSSENRQLRDQLSQLSIELDQQRVRYQGSLAEVERIARQEREASHDELCSLRTQHKKELDNVKQDYAIEHSRSKLAEMSNKIASLEIVIERLKDKLARSTETETELASKKVHEEVLKQEVHQLKSDLKKAKQFHTPEMQHYAQLEDKISAMETRHRQREHDLQTMIHKMQLTADVEKDQVLLKWRNLLRKKTEETERFRVELDGILSILEDLRQQGVVIPVKHAQTEHLHW